jgi:hypothetical protein
MPDDALSALRRLVHQDAPMQARLFALTDAGTFVVAARELALAAGLVVSEEELRLAMATGRRAWLDRKEP